MNKAKNLIITVAMKPMISSEINKELWEHSIKTAVGCECLSSHLNLMKENDAFIIGFMHDIGKIFLNMQDKEKFYKVNELIKQGEDILEVEKHFYGVDHAQLGSVLANKWQLPILLSNSMKYHHTPLLASAPAESALVYLIDKLVKNDFNENSINKDFIKSLNFKLDKPEILRNFILDKARILIKELSNN